MIRRVSRRLQNLVWKTKRAETLRINWDQSVKVFFLDRRIPMVTVTEQGEDLAEQPREQRRSAALKGVLTTL